MSNGKHTPGPWKLAPTDDTIVIDANGTVIAAASGEYSAEDERPIMEANARLIAAAPAMFLALDLISHGLARIERSKHVPDLVEFCFDGIRYSLNGNWNDLFDVIGWDRARAALAAYEASK